MSGSSNVYYSVCYVDGALQMLDAPIKTICILYPCIKYLSNNKLLLLQNYVEKRKSTTRPRHTLEKKT